MKHDPHIEFSFAIVIYIGAEIGQLKIWQLGQYKVVDRSSAIYAAEMRFTAMCSTASWYTIPANPSTLDDMNGVISRQLWARVIDCDFPSPVLVDVDMTVMVRVLKLHLHFCYYCCRCE